MAIKDQINPRNTSGKYYVDTDCIACSNCISLAPDNFLIANDHLCYVIKQPADDNETENVIKALNSCPVGSIGDDGEVLIG